MDEDVNRDYSVSKEYQTGEFPLSYRNFLVEKFKVQEAFASECLQKIFQSGQIPGTRLLDFGCGPTIHKIASASLQFNEIILSDYSEVNRKEVEKWLRGDKDALDWTPLLELCARAEGYRDLEESVKEIEIRIRNAVKKVVLCDAQSKDILPTGIGNFDVITSFCCLEGCCFTVDKYKDVVKTLASYLKQGGVMVMLSVLQCKRYYVHKYLPGFQLTEEIIKEALAEAGLQLKDWFSWKDTAEYDHIKFDGTVIYYAVKK